MKKLLFWMLITLILSSTQSYAIVLDDAVSWLHDNGLTMFSNTTDYKPNNYIRRDEAAKFFVNYAKLLGIADYTKDDSQCKFSDISQSHSDLQNIVIESCKLWLFQWSSGKFLPRNGITNGQAITVLIRLIDGRQSESWVTHRSDNYYKKANELNLLNNVSMNNKTSSATRGNIAILLYNIQDTESEISWYNSGDIEDFISSLLDV